MCAWYGLRKNDIKSPRALVDAGFEYVTNEYNDGGKIFRKPNTSANITWTKPGIFNIGGAGGGIRTHEPLWDSL